MVKKVKANVVKNTRAKPNTKVTKSSKAPKKPSTAQLLAKIQSAVSTFETLESRITAVERQLNASGSNGSSKQNEDEKVESLRSEVEIVARNLAKLRSEFNSTQRSEPSSGDVRSRHGVLVENPPSGVDANARGELRRD